MDLTNEIITYSSTILELSGILIIGTGALVATTAAAIRYFGKGTDIYINYRRQLSRAILLGLEFLVAADIIKTVAIEPTFLTVGILGAIVLIRTFLSFALEVEVTGKWPWGTNKD